MPKKTSVQKRRKPVPGSKSQGTRKTSSSAKTIRPAVKAKSRKSARTDTNRQQKKMADAYQVSENHIRLITDNLPVLISYVDREQRFRFNNELYEKWFGHPRSFFYGKHVKEVLGDKVYECVQKHFEKALSGQKVIHETLMPYKYGNTRYVHAEFIPDFGKQGEVLGLYALIADITERKQTEDLLNESEKKFRQLAENIEEVFWMEDKEGEEIIYISPAFEKVWGLKCEDLIENPQLWMDSIHPEDREKIENEYSYEDRTQVIEGKYKSEFRIIRPDGKVCWISDRAFPVLNEEGNPIRIAGISQDITELKLIEQELQGAKETLELRVQERTMELRQRNRQLKNLLAHLENVREEERVHIAREVHDELGQILLAFKFDLSELEELISPDSKGVGDLVKKLIKDADTTLESVQRILTGLRPQVLDIFGVGPAFEWQANEFQDQTGIACEVIHFPENLQMDKEKSLLLFRILQEALMNVKHHAKASRVQINFSGNSEDMIMEIKDNGVGIKPENVNDPQSFGILGIQERADLLGGTASFRSNPGEGTTVSIRLTK